MALDRTQETIGEKSFLKRLDTWLRLSHLTYGVPEHGRSFFFSLGGVVFAGFLLMVATGFILAQLYNPVPAQAYKSLEKIQSIGWASYIRALHYWTAQGVIVALLLHMGRVFITGAYKHPRQVIWWLGVALFGVMLMGSYFSGTVLKWDQEGFDALNHYKESLRQLGPIGALLSERLPGSTPINLRMYVSHITVFPVLIIILIVLHFYLIHAFNLSPTPWGRFSNEPEIPSHEIKGKFNEHAQSIFILSMMYYGFLAILAFFVRAPLMEASTGVESPVKPPWPFLWVYLFENIWGVKAVIYASAVLFAFLILVPLIDRKQERKFRARKGILGMGGLFAMSLFGLTLHGWFATPQLHEHEHGHDEEEGAHMEGEAHEEDGHTHEEETEEHGHDDAADHHD